MPMPATTQPLPMIVPDPPVAPPPAPEQRPTPTTKQTGTTGPVTTRVGRVVKKKPVRYRVAAGSNTM